jgi:P27 family predicted phage terminase small subunit
MSRKKPLPPPPPEPPPPPDPPEQLDLVAATKWVELIPAIWNCHSRALGDIDALTAYCSAWSRWRTADQKVRELGTVIKSPSGYPVQSPFLSIANRAADEMRKWGKLLGLTANSGPLIFHPEEEKGPE